MRVIVTRPAQQAAKWVDLLRAAHLEAEALPLLAVEAVAERSALRGAWQKLQDYNAVLFVSASAIHHFFDEKPDETPVFSAQAAIKTRAFVTGSGSFAAMLRVGAQEEFIDAPARDARQVDSEALWTVVSAQIQPGFRLLIVRGSDLVNGADDVADNGAGRDWFAEHARAAGVMVDFVVAYRRSCPKLSVAQRALAQDAATDRSIWLFTSAKAIANLLQLFPEQSWNQARAVVTHPRIGHAARAAGFSVVCESRPDAAALVASIESMQ